MSARDNDQIKANHDNSLNEYRDISTNITPRHEMILHTLDVLEQQDVSNITDRQIASACGFTDMNSVRPRITELIKMGEIVDGVSVTCPVSDKKVRTLHSLERVNNLMREAELE